MTDPTAAIPPVSPAPADTADSLATKAVTKAATEAATEAVTEPVISPIPQPPGEIGGPRGLEPTRFGDWEFKGRCSDF